MNTYFVIVVASVVLIMMLRRRQATDDDASSVPGDVPRDVEGVKLLFARGHPFKAVRLAQEISAGDPARARAIIEALQVHVTIGGSGETATTIAGMLEPAKDREIQAFLLSGNKIEAIKRWRTLTGQGLKESKDAIDRLANTPPS
jgi:ribosomal protein L7/L12